MTTPLPTKHPFLLMLAFLLLGMPRPVADEPKNHDFDVVRDEAAVPPYQLPPILVSAEGRAITTPEAWFQVRRPQILALF
ncbi:MAG: hypothetical protein EBU81_07400, partial [Proteobacteria bacterium]|nr:hypothetical protein [Pseudomonadota bacterium]